MENKNMQFSVHFDAVRDSRTFQHCISGSLLDSEDPFIAGQEKAISWCETHRSEFVRVGHVTTYNDAGTVVLDACITKPRDTSVARLEVLSAAIRVPPALPESLRNLAAVLLTDVATALQDALAHASPNIEGSPAQCAYQEIVAREALVRSAYDKLSEVLLRTCEARNAAKEAVDAEALASRENVPTDWAWLLEENGVNSSKARYAARNQKLEALGLAGSGYFPELAQAAVRVCLRRGDAEQLAQVTKGLAEVLPYLKRHPSRGDGTDELPAGYAVVSIFDRGLSARNHWVLLANLEKSEYCIADAYHFRYGHSIVFKTDSLAAALAEVQRTYWYSDGTDDNDDEID